MYNVMLFIILLDTVQVIMSIITKKKKKKTYSPSNLFNCYGNKIQTLLGQSRSYTWWVPHLQPLQISKECVMDEAPFHAAPLNTIFLKDRSKNYTPVVLKPKKVR
jgi:hypothetical protein